MSNDRDEVLDAVLGDVVGDPKKADATVVDKKVNSSQLYKFKPGVGVDIGTSNIVVSRQTEEGTFVNKYHRNMLYPLDISEEATDLLEKGSYLYVKVGNKYYVVGEDALTLVNALGTGEIIRPMKDGILNPSLKEATELLFYIIKAVVGAPIIPNEPLRYSLPANPIDVNLDNLFHKMILMGFFKKLGFDPKPVNEAMCIAYDCNPVMKSDAGEVPLSGIVCSCGAGMWNIALAFKGLPVVEFSCTKSGDYLDEEVSRMTGIDRAKVIKIKEKKLDLDNVDMGDRVQAALSIYYDEMIERMLQSIAKHFQGQKSEMDGEIELVLAGGTSMAPGFCKRVEAVLANGEFPMKVYRVRHSKTPFYSVVQGACVRAQADYSKLQKK
jgi:actin-like ATPase involved in cell morphogenesis